MVFVIHPAAGVHQVPEAWLDALLPTGFRKATRREIAAWYEERGLEPPPPRRRRARPDRQSS